MNQWLQLRSARFYRSCLLVVAGLFGLTGVILQYGVVETVLSGLVARVSSGVALGLFLVEQIVAAVTVRPWRHWLSSTSRKAKSTILRPAHRKQR